jgi:hypothetical protein
MGCVYKLPGVCEISHAIYYKSGKSIEFCFWHSKVELLKGDSASARDDSDLSLIIRAVMYVRPNY